MGRLTLNVLLSFAQFEREVTAEAHKLAQEITTQLDTFADDIIDEEAEQSFRQVMALLDEAAAI